MELTGRVALVTGGAKRVGRAIVERLAAAGCNVAFTYFNSQREAQELAERLVASGRQVVTMPADLAEPDRAVAAIATAFSNRFGRLDILVNNASLYQPSSLQAVTLQQSRRFWALHVEAPLLLCRHFEAHLRHNRGHVINMVDLIAERPRPDHLIYCASKAALANMTVGLARELAPEVTVNGIAPGVVDWPHGIAQQKRAEYLQRVPLAHAGTPADVAELIYYLCTTGNYITGQIIRLDGGRSIV
ncbi:MAG: SDR family oxidoreductase [Planctomycetota bacterium]|nr:SDR family oxidoreductase [Planctomycetota bacterium]